MKDYSDITTKELEVQLNEMTSTSSLVQLDKATLIIDVEFRNKKDLNGEPYVGHLIRVASPCISHELRTIAFLHDLLEDIPSWNKERLSKHFSKEVVDAVVCLTKSYDIPYEMYIERLKTNKLALNVKISDLEDNMKLTRFIKELRDSDIKRLRKYQKSYLNLKNFRNGL